MDFQLTDVQQNTQRSFREFVDKYVKPKAAEIDEQKQFPTKLFQAVGKMDFFGMRYPQKSGGTGSDVVSYTLAVIELSRGSLSLAMVCTMQSLMATYFLHRLGDKEVMDYFHKALRGENIGAICMTEPNAGSDLFGIQTKVVTVKDQFILTGQKTWVTSAPVADFFTVLAKTDHHDGLSIFFVPADTKGVSIGKTIDKLGVRGSVTSEVAFDEVVLPKNYLLGKLGDGTKYLNEVLDEIRIMTAALAIGVGQAAFEDALEYANTRTQFGKVIGKFQAIKMKFADMAMQLETARHYVLYVADLSEKNLPRHKEAMIAKLYASECANSICDHASRVLASYGYATEFSLQRYLRDARFTLIGGGTSEILKLQIGKELGL